MDTNKRREYLENLQFGDVIFYYEKGSGSPTYLIVQKVKGGEILGHMASPIAVNGISIDKLLARDLEFLKKANFEDI